jgi:hypothetical protein
MMVGRQVRTLTGHAKPVGVFFFIISPISNDGWPLSIKISLSGWQMRTLTGHSKTVDVVVPSMFCHGSRRR